MTNMATVSHAPYSAFAFHWTYGPITEEQDRSARLYAQSTQTTHETVATVPGFWINPPR
jgi:hypothetical protein